MPVNPALTEAIEEAYASAPDDVVILFTIELRHPNFRDSNNQPIALRFVLDNRDWIGRLEATAPMDAGSFVIFIAAAFEIELPGAEERGGSIARLRIDNIDAQILEQIDLAATDQNKTQITIRPYLSNDVDAQGRLNGPHQNPPTHMTLRSVYADSVSVVADLGFDELSNMSFPGKVYDQATFPDLYRE